MIYTDNKQLINELKKVMIDTQTKQIDIANTLNVPKQAITKILTKKNINFEDLKKLLDIMEYEINFEFVPKK